ncbi:MULTISPECIES: hypothetical protein [Paracoccus]|uniref:hypothetical protein n=1 Tax=Paracoccus TaxID=265 RepID=UPI001FB56FD2|nr:MULTISPECIES: hypothetical protein [Paracoccus]MCJ1898872.1 hypothetical protein [Paracoccus versutus]MDF3903278.1 hypothetical protein [Paracoccus sp. AS002]WGR61048.1 hypothetical protein E3U26_10185 [Paracoccus ferrooxidans]
MAEQNKSNLWLIVGVVVVVLVVIYWFVSSGTEPTATEPPTAPAVSSEPAPVDDGAVSVEPPADAAPADPAAPAAPAPAEPATPAPAN